ncbi:probable amidase At4g34880 [Punica granatum]|uniref:Amidase domain-containing protein n=2 Tax=Punica granatum TaxID=22663 RepID=A0A218X6Q5_PUNGR|nr:probable amidase At4g34880 [Punica granatum]OWM80376.1 hypothetical protein CDL15_Pgr019656 [Punica granatum]PKI52906.1 hypothetical protein CRG98_026737 [Punica granatum]
MTISTLLCFFCLFSVAAGDSFSLKEATIGDIQLAFSRNEITSRRLTELYLSQIESLNPLLRCVLEVNPDALEQAEEADRRRLAADLRGDLDGVPVLLKDSIETADKMNTTLGSYALLGARAERAAHVVERLRMAGAVILGKASLSEWYSLRSPEMPPGWCARSGQGLNPYVESGDPCGSSSGSAIAVAANMVAVSLGTETDSSIICPADHNSVVGFKPTVGLTSRAGVVPISARQDSVGPICRTVADATLVLESIIGLDPRDNEATKEASTFIPEGGYKQFLKEDGLEGKRLGIVRNPFSASFNGSTATRTFEDHLRTLRNRGATVVDNLEISNIDIIMDPMRSGEMPLLLAEFRRSINRYLKELADSPVRSLAEVITFNLNHPDMEKMDMYNQDGLIAAEMTSALDDDELTKAEKIMEQLSRDGFEKLMKENELDAMVTLGANAATVMAIGGYPAITVPGGYDEKGMPFGICFGGLKGAEPKLIEIAYSFEQATMMQRPPFSTFSSKMDNHCHE